MVLHPLLILFVYSFINSIFSYEIKASIVSSLSIVKFLLFCLFSFIVKLEKKNFKNNIFYFYILPCLNLLMYLFNFYLEKIYLDFKYFKIRLKRPIWRCKLIVGA